MALYRPPVPEGSAIITPNQMYREVVAIRNSVGDLVARLTGLPDTLQDQETRLRAVEGRVWVASGVATVVTAAAAIVVPLLVK